MIIYSSYKEKAINRQTEGTTKKSSRRKSNRIFQGAKGLDIDTFISHQGHCDKSGKGEPKIGIEIRTVREVLK